MQNTRGNLPVVTPSAGLIACLTVLLLAGQSSWRPVAAEEPTKAQQEPQAASETDNNRRSLDEALLEDLDNELLEGLGDLKDLRSEPDSPSPDTEPLEPLLDGEDVGQPSATDDPLGYISQEMRMAEQLIPQRGKRSQAEQLQRRIVEDLARLIEQAERQRAQQQSSNAKQRQQTARRRTVKQPKSSTGQNPGQNSNKPAADSTDRLGQAERARLDPELFRGLLKDAWGHLPEREREQMMQMSQERFLPQYELLIQRYYQRLAAEHTK